MTGGIVSNADSHTVYLYIGQVVTGEEPNRVFISVDFGAAPEPKRPTAEDVVRMLADEVAREQAAERNERRNKRQVIRQRERLRRNPRAKGFGWVRGQ